MLSAAILSVILIGKGLFPPLGRFFGSEHSLIVSELLDICAIDALTKRQEVGELHLRHRLTTYNTTESTTLTTIEVASGK